MVPCAIRWLLQTVTLSCGSFSDVTTRLKSCGINTKWSIFMVPESLPTSNLFSFIFLSDCPLHKAIFYSFKLFLYFLLPPSQQFVYDHIKVFISFLWQKKSFFYCPQTKAQKIINQPSFVETFKNLLLEIKNINRFTNDLTFPPYSFNDFMCTGRAKITNILPWPSEWENKHTSELRKPIPAVFIRSAEHRTQKQQMIVDRYRCSRELHGERR